jgi:hypothetical protein
LAICAGCSPPPPPPIPPTAPPPPPAVAWTAIADWDGPAETGFSEFVAGFARAVRDRRCTRLEECLRDPVANPLWNPATDEDAVVEADCADLPYALRAWYAWKHRLPFSFVARVEGSGGGDARYMSRITPTRWHSAGEYATPEALLRELRGSVHSGMYRTTPDVEDADFYPIALSRSSVRPGAIFYDVGGHVLIVAEVARDGNVHFIDAHPDGTIGWTRFDGSFSSGPAALGGGWKRFRPQSRGESGPVRAGNRGLFDLDWHAQWDPRSWIFSGKKVSYFDWVRDSLREPDAPAEPLADVREELDAICRQVVDRAAAVERAASDGISTRPHPRALPANIYGTNGDWETYATPGRDAHLKGSFRALREAVAALPEKDRLAAQGAWKERAADPECRARYTDSGGATVELSLDAVLDRLFALSFDPYHCPERRWGVPESSREFARCTDDETAARFYRDERRLRFRVDRGVGQPTALTDGPDAPPDVDPRPLLGLDPHHLAHR